METNNPNYRPFHASASLVSAVSHTAQELFQADSAALFQASLQLQLHAYDLSTHNCALLLQELATVLSADADAQTLYRNSFLRGYSTYKEEHPSASLIAAAASAHKWAYNASIQ